MDREQEAYFYWLDGIPGIGRVTIRKILAQLTPKEVYDRGMGSLASILTKRQAEMIEEYRKKQQPQKEWEKLKRKKIRMVWKESLDYPEKLQNIPNSPEILYTKGKIQGLSLPAVAVIGARNCSSYGALAAKELGRELAEQGITVVSGMARGIDGISQWAALEAGGYSIGVLGSGVEVCYPQENRPLYERLQREGCLLSEYPPYTKPQSGLFPLRNRLISGLADVVVVVEAREKSGTLITVDLALEQGKEVYAMPGRITDPLSSGCNRLLAQGAGILLSPREFAKEYTRQIGWKEKKEQKGEKVKMTKEEEMIYRLLEPLPMPVEEIWRRGREQAADLTLAKVMEVLLNLVMTDLVCTHEQYFYRKQFVE